MLRTSQRDVGKLLSLVRNVLGVQYNCDVFTALKPFSVELDKVSECSVTISPYLNSKWTLSWISGEKNNVKFNCIPVDVSCFNTNPESFAGIFKDIVI